VRRILIIDNDPLVRRGLAAMLDRSAYEVEGAANGDIGLRVYRRRGANLVITDLTLTGITGIEVIVAIVHGPRPAPVIAMCGADSDELEHAKLVGASATLQKPFTADELFAVIHATLARPPAP
jgi:DNA-binding response OmpR family regulator